MTPDAQETLHVELDFLWYDFWVGFFWDCKNRVLYICPLPCVVFKIWFTEDGDA